MAKKGKRGCCSSFLVFFIVIGIIGAIGGGESGKKENSTSVSEKKSVAVLTDNAGRTISEKEKVSENNKESIPAAGESEKSDLKEISAVGKSLSSMSESADIPAVKQDGKDTDISNDGNKSVKADPSVETDSMRSAVESNSILRENKDAGNEADPEESKPVEEETYEAVKRGSSGNTVVEIQNRLIALGYLASGADGKFGSGTEKAVKDFQESNQLDASGIVDKATYDKIISVDAREKEEPFTVIKRGDRGDPVIEIQKQLITLGFLTSAADGVFGGGTEQAVKNFQNANDLELSGTIDESTYNKIFSPEAKHYTAPLIKSDAEGTDAGTRNSPNVSSSSGDSSMTVWLSATGEKYHRINNCGRMNPNKARAVSLEEAKARGYEPCSKCM